MYVSLKNLELVYSEEHGKWVYLDTRNNSIYVSNKKIIANRYIRNGFYPLEYSFLWKKKLEEIQCSYCGNFISIKSITRDHIYPKSRGGSITTPACDPCNTIKRAMLPIEWALEATQSGLAFGDKKEIEESYAALTEDKSDLDAVT